MCFSPHDLTFCISSTFLIYLLTIIELHKQYHAHLAWPPLLADQYAEPGISPHHTAPRSWPLPPTADMMYSMTRCHTLKGHVSDHAHRICWKINRIREEKIEKPFNIKTYYLPR